MDRRTIEAAAFQTDDIEAGKLCSVSGCGRKRDDVSRDARQAANEGVGANSGPLMDAGEAAYDCVITNRDMTGERHAVDDNDVVADVAIMRDMGPDHQVAIIFDPSQAATVSRSPMHRDMFADDAVGPDLNRRLFAAIADVLRRAANDGVGVNLRAWPDARLSLDDDVAMQDRVVGDIDLRANYAERADLDVAADPCAVLDNRRSMDFTGHAATRRISAR